MFNRRSMTFIWNNKHNNNDSSIFGRYNEQNDHLEDGYNFHIEAYEYQYHKYKPQHEQDECSNHHKDPNDYHHIDYHNRRTGRWNVYVTRAVPCSIVYRLNESMKYWLSQWKIIA